MFEEAQLYSPVSTGEDGSVTVHLAHDHPGANDDAINLVHARFKPGFWRRNQLPPRIPHYLFVQEFSRTTPWIVSTSAPNVAPLVKH